MNKIEKKTTKINNKKTTKKTTKRHDIEHYVYSILVFFNFILFYFIISKFYGLLL
ncbi:hypothetical protein RNJ44_00859 [Nakaseomyces bracarensis]|uniref:Uncharacterized protein n=1 Tax=Nakaseomyces bracarensis TaxID=273131 RepID=A0ABR4NQE9_9SACH